jgi:dihydroorotase
VADEAGYDLLIRGGRVLDPGRGVDRVADVAFLDGRVAAVEEGIDPDGAAEILDAVGTWVVPGLIDFHAHVYWGGTALGVDAEEIGARSGTTTFVDAGSAGAGNFPGFRRHVIEPSRVRILAFLNVSFAGIYALSRELFVPEGEDLRLLHTGECVRVAREHADVVVGVKVRLGHYGSGAAGLAPLAPALAAAEELGLPVMVHIDLPPPDLGEVLDRLRAGDVLTHCSRPAPNAPVLDDGRLRDEMVAARERGVVFDVGHGAGSFGFGVARRLLEQGFVPDVISSDVHAISVDGPAYDVLVTMTKLLALGLPLEEVVRRVTAAPAAVLGRPDLGTLTPGAVGDATLLQLVDGEFDLIDATGERLRTGSAFALRDRVKDGKWLARAPSAPAGIIGSPANR